MNKTDILLTIGAGSVAGILIVNHFAGGRAYAAADDAKKKADDAKKKADDAKKVMVKAMAPMCQCPDGTIVQSVATPGKMNDFTCPCMALTGQLGQPGIAPQALGRGVTVLPQAAGVRAMPGQTVPNLMLMPGQVGGLLAGGTALQARAFAAEDDIAAALKDAGIGMAEQKKLMDALKKQDMGKMNMAKAMKNQVCTCPDKTKVMAANGLCNCAAIQAAGAIGLNRNILAVPQGQQLGQLTGLQGQVPMFGGQRQQDSRRMRQVIPMGGVSPTNTGQVCVLDPVSNNFLLSGTNPPVMCDPGPGLTTTRDPTLGMVGQSPQTPLSPADKSGASLTALYGHAYLGDSTQGMGKELPLIPCDDEDLYEEFGDLKQDYPYTHIQDMVSQYDEDSHVVPFFITEPESYKQISLLPSNYPRR